MPFDKNKYKRLMGGLECVELRFSDVYNDDNFTKRFDAEYQRKKFLENVKSLNNIGAIELCSGQGGYVNGGKRIPKGESFSDSGIKYARAEDNKGNFLSVEDSPYISEALHNVLSRYTTEYNDVLITNVGNGIGDVTINKYTDITINLTENCVKVNKLKGLSPEILFIYLKSKYGYLQIYREKVGTAQPKLSIERIRKFLVPKFSDSFDKKISNIVNAAHLKEKESKDLYHTAEILYKNYVNIDIKNILDKNNTGINVKRFSETFLNTERLDAEYYQKKYEFLVNELNKTDTMLLGDITISKKSIEPGSEYYTEEGIPFVRVSDMTKYGIELGNAFLPTDIVVSPQKLYPKKDTILFSKDGTVGIAYKIMEDSKIITSSALLHLRIKDKNVTPNYLTLALNSDIVRMQAERDTNGSILQHWKKDEIEKVIVPIISMDKQKIINEKIDESFNKLDESKKLITRAIKAVETAVEKSEKEAMRSLN